MSTHSGNLGPGVDLTIYGSRDGRSSSQATSTPSEFTHVRSYPIQFDTTNAVTRVMSPTPTNNGLLMGCYIQCPDCRRPANDPGICGQCGRYGHPTCIGFQLVNGYPFCGSCARLMAAQVAALQDADRKLDWCLRINQQLVDWKALARDAIGGATSIGLSIGGAAAVVTGTVVAGCQGIAQGIKTASVKNSTSDDPPGAESSQRRCNSAGDLPRVTRATLTGCAACDFKAHKAHTYTGGCRGLPREVYFPGAERGRGVAQPQTMLLSPPPLRTPPRHAIGHPSGRSAH